jgi:prepilin-type N-terminal cleavage/methylation domain-containing protein
VRRAGFTLIEIVLATVLFSMLMASYYTVFIRVVVLEEHARGQRAFGNIGPAVLDLMEDDVGSLYTHPRQPDAFPFRGEDDNLAGQAADRMDFVTRRASIRQQEFFGHDRWLRSPINETGWRLARGASRLGYVRTLYRRESFYPDATPLQGGEFYEVYDRVVSLDIAYAGYQVEEEGRKDAETAAERNLDKFESWDSEERRGFPTALLVTLTVEAPQVSLADRDRERGTETRETRTFFRIIPLVQGQDVLPPQGAPAEAPPPGTNPNPNPNTNPNTNTDPRGG